MGSSEEAKVYSAMFRRTIEPGDAIEEEPCIQKGLLRIYEEEHGRPCPRVEVEPCNVEAMTLTSCLMRDDTRPLFGPLFERLCDFLPGAEQLQVLERVHRALQDPKVNDAISTRLKASRA